jgi:glycogen debranching enzyme
MKPDSTKDLRDHVPDLIPYLMPEEVVTSVEEHTISYPKEKLDPVTALCHLAKVSKPEDIGTNGPPTASVSIGTNLEDEVFRKYEVVFGRDSLYMSDHVLNAFPHLAKVTLLHLASYQGVEKNIHQEEEFGRIPHEIRDPTDPIAKKLTQQLGWQWPYYATIDATLLFIRVMYRYITEIPNGEQILEEKYTGRDGKEHTLFDALENAVTWMLSRMDQNPQGFIETYAAFSGSHIIQSLQDSHTGSSIFDETGKYANPKKGIAPIEVQGQAYDALIFAADIFEKSGKDKYSRYSPEKLRTRAEKVRKNIYALWQEDENGAYFPVGTERDEHNRIRVLKVRKGISGFLLNTEIFNTKINKDGDVNEIRDVLPEFVKTLLSNELLAPGGIRGLSTDHPRFLPTSYHNGTTWPVITYEVACGLRKQGFIKDAENLENRILKIVEVTNMYPEFVRSDADLPIKIPNRNVEGRILSIDESRSLERPPQLYQGWSVTAVVAILHSRKKV